MPWNDLYEVLLGIILALIPIVVPLVVNRVLDKLKVEADEGRRRALNEALINGIAFATDRMGLTGQKHLTASEKDAVSRDAAAYAAEKVPDTIKKLGVPTDSLLDLAKARLPQVLGLFGPAGAVAGLATQIAIEAVEKARD